MARWRVVRSAHLLPAVLLCLVVIDPQTDIDVVCIYCGYDLFVVR